MLLQAAAEEFSERPPSTVTIRDVCRRAGVSVSVMYRHFNDKAELFRESMLTPLTGFADEFAATWQGQRIRPWDARRLMRSFVESLYEALIGRRYSLIALASAAQHEQSDVIGELQSSIAGLFERLTLIGSAEADERAWFSSEGLDLAIRLIVGQVLGYVAFESVLMAGQDNVPADLVLDEITDLVIYGLRRAPTAAAIRSAGV